MYLASHAEARFGHPISGQNEVCGVRYKGKPTDWYAAEGIYMPRKPKKTPAENGSSSSSSDSSGEADKDEL